jgi:penicillin amidase
MLGTAEYRVLGPHLADLGARARMIRDDLKALAAPDETGLFSIYRDDRAQFLERWRELMLRTLDRGTSGTNGAAWSAARRAVMDWGGRAAVDSVGYRLVRAFRFKVGDLFFEPLTRECREVSPGLGVDSARWERPLWTCLEARPPQFLNPRFTDYDALLRMAVEAILVDLERQGLTVEQATWGQRNTVRIQHPLSGAVPKLASWLDLPPRALSGDDHMPKVQGIRFGASERMVVSPGREERGFLQMPGGQSGHFLSPFYRAGSTAWEEVEPTPLLPGPVQHRLELVPVAALTPALSRSP